MPTPLNYCQLQDEHFWQDAGEKAKATASSVSGVLTTSVSNAEAWMSYQMGEEPVVPPDQPSTTINPDLANPIESFNSTRLPSVSKSTSMPDSQPNGGAPPPS